MARWLSHHLKKFSVFKVDLWGHSTFKYWKIFIRCFLFSGWNFHIAIFSATLKFYLEWKFSAKSVECEKWTTWRKLRQKWRTNYKVMRQMTFLWFIFPVSNGRGKFFIKACRKTILQIEIKKVASFLDDLLVACGRWLLSWLKLKKFSKMAL